MKTAGKEAAENGVPAAPKKISSLPESLSGQKEVTKIIAVSSDKVLPSDAAQAAYSSGYPVTLKETCYGLVLTGTKENVDAVVKAVMDMDKNHIFVKDRGFPTGDPRRCRAVRNGGQRPGFYTLHEEISKMGTIGAALDNYDAKVKKKAAEWPDKPSSFKLENYINSEFGENKKEIQNPKVIADKIKSKGKNPRSGNEKTAGKTAEKTAEKTPVSKSASKAPVSKSASKAPAGKSAAKAPVSKSAAKAPVSKSAAKAPAGKSAAKAPVSKTAAKAPISKSAAKAPVIKPAEKKIPAKTTAVKKTTKTAAEKKTAAAKK
ncbi:MAG: methanogenesis marker 6 protein [Methanimicrococcus sp.]|nr:methanogenesis marker 6 protein [Methanimicrococcus sp.]